ncbi:methylated-DNA--protein-cysteine methyltransferase [Elysia marginata]|uniref:Methylated-DNA--protein-cysteine methyltransferase n=1 Tax=Elysia marginata TaxID=1093978 RepID=A0AAV4EGW8_9GAST|nr:methylated-DNA--protein-cysteine methyltransferase [Elysia marginata]
MKHPLCQCTSFTVTSPVGDIVIMSCSSGLHSVKQCEEDDSSFAPNNRCCVKLKSQNANLLNCPPAQECIAWLEEYFTNQVAKIEIPPLCSSIRKDGSFCGKAWQILPSAAPFGTTITYKDLASLCGNEKACRAAGQAMSTNPISYLIPCHRVVTTGSGIGNYSQGRKNKIKRWLLDFEQINQNEWSNFYFKNVGVN